MEGGSSPISTACSWCYASAIKRPRILCEEPGSKRRVAAFTCQQGLGETWGAAAAGSSWRETGSVWGGGDRQAPPWAVVRGWVDVGRPRQKCVSARGWWCVWWNISVELIYIMWSNFLFRLVIASGLSKFYDRGFILQEDELMIVSSQTIKQTA